MQCRCSVGSERAAASHARLARAPHTYQKERAFSFCSGPALYPVHLSIPLSFSLSPFSPLPLHSLVISVSAVYPSLRVYIRVSSSPFFLFFSLSLSLHMYTCVYVYEYILSSGRVRVRLLYPASSLSLLVARVPELSSLELLRINLYVYVYTCSSQCLHSTCTSCTFRIIVDVWMETPSSCVALSVSHRVGGSSHPHRRVGVHADETGTGRLDRHVAVAVLASRCF